MWIAGAARPAGALRDGPLPASLRPAPRHGRMLEELDRMLAEAQVNAGIDEPLIGKS